MQIFTTSDGRSLAYYIDDFTNPWPAAPAVLLLHAAMGDDVEFLTDDGLPHNISDAVLDRCAADVRDFLARHFPD